MKDVELLRETQVVQEPQDVGHNLTEEIQKANLERDMKIKRLELTNADLEDRNEGYRRDIKNLEENL